MGCVNRVWGKVEVFIWSCTQDVRKGRDIYVGCVNRLVGKADIFMRSVYTVCGGKERYLCGMCA